ncbi:hypothetical protein KP509_25G070800 [Ceratopteris richardii]|nr:hypothetical protein KP509_25G070800 [Ceratopteris richardii]
MDKYLGVIEFEGIVHWVLHQAEILGAIPRVTDSGVAAVGGATTPDATIAKAFAGGEFFEELISSDLYKNTKVKDIAGSFRWAPFVPIQNSDNLLTLLLLLSKYRVKNLPVVESGEGRIENFITQSAVIRMLSECIDFPWFESLGAKPLSEIGLPRMKHDKLVKVEEDQPILEAFQLMQKKSVDAVPVVAKGGIHLVGNISMRDIEFLLVVPEIYKTDRLLTVKDFLDITENHLKKSANDKDQSFLTHVVTCTEQEATRDVILKLNKYHIHRVYVANEEGNAVGVVTMRELISKFVKEPVDYFGEFFLGWAPSCPSPH